uniref:Uncharacterized protein n=1 Tax=Anguilla anguilla TaxID=7936 RepID=A0A0E9PRX8_ANGAN
MQFIQCIKRTCSTISSQVITQRLVTSKAAPKNVFLFCKTVAFELRGCQRPKSAQHRFQLSLTPTLRLNPL